MRSAAKLPIHPFNALLRIVLGIGEEVVPFATAEKFNHAILAPSLGVVEVCADQMGQFVPTGYVQRRRLVRKVLPLAPVRQRVGVKEEGCPLPELRMVKECDYSAFVVVGERREFFGKFRVRLRFFRQVPLRFVEDRAASLLSAHLEDVAEVCVHRVALTVRQFQPRLKQLVRLGFLHGRKVQFREHAMRLKVAGQQPVWHLSEEIACGVVTAHIPLAIERKLPALLDIVECCCT